MYQAYEYASNAVSLVKFLLEIVLRNPKTLKNPKNEWNQHFIGHVLIGMITITEYTVVTKNEIEYEMIFRSDKISRIKKVW